MFAHASSTGFSSYVLNCNVPLIVTISYLEDRTYQSTLHGTQAKLSGNVRPRDVLSVDVIATAAKQID